MISKLNLVFFLTFSKPFLCTNKSESNDQETNILHPFQSINLFLNSFTDQFSITKTKGQINAYSFLKPQSFSVLMNFRYDGQQWIQVIELF